MATVLMAPVFLVVGLVVGAGTAPPQVETASEAGALASSSLSAARPAAPVPLLAAPATTSGAAVPVDQVPTTTLQAAATSTRATTRPATRTPARAVHTGAAPAPVVRREVAPPATATATQRSTSRPTSTPRATPKATPDAEPDTGSSTCDEDTHYVNAKGNCVLRPVAAASAPDGATARCTDGTYSSSRTRQGTCSRHGGVAQWL